MSDAEFREYELPGGFVEAIARIVDSEVLSDLEPDLAKQWRAGSRTWDITHYPDESRIGVVVWVLTKDGAFKVAEIDGRRLGFRIADGAALGPAAWQISGSEIAL